MLVDNSRVPVGVSHTGRGDVVVVCGDGAVFWLSPLTRGWDEMLPIPGSYRAGIIIADSGEILTESGIELSTESGAGILVEHTP